MPVDATVGATARPTISAGRNVANGSPNPPAAIDVSFVDSREIDGLLDVDLEGFRGITDTVGGVDVHVPQTVRDPKRGGTYTVDMNNRQVGRGTLVTDDGLSDAEISRLAARLRDRGAVLLVQGPWPQAEAVLRDALRPPT